jgi:hypothetical protein
VPPEHVAARIGVAEALVDFPVVEAREEGPREARSDLVGAVLAFEVDGRELGPARTTLERVEQLGIVLGAAHEATPLAVWTGVKRSNESRPS